MSTQFTRRTTLAAGGSLITAWLAGCNSQPESVEVLPQTPRSEVPLRVLLIGDSPATDTITRGWSAANSAAIKLEVIDIPRAEAGRLTGDVLSKAKSNDVLIVPLISVGELFTGEQLTKLELSSLPGLSEATTTLPAAIRSGVARFADQTVALPLGGQVPAVFSVESIEPLNSWDEYATLVDKSWQGAAAEPSAAGWAAAMFLWRASWSAGEAWLFDRDSLSPLIDSESYVETLTLMVETHRQYKQPRMTPAEIWSELKKGTLRGGIAFPGRDVDAFPDVQLTGMPTGQSVARVLFDPFTPIAAISSGCRQTTLAKQFLAWLATADGTATLKQSLDGVLQVIAPEQGLSNSGDSGSVYEQWLHGVWRTPLVRMNLQLLGGGGYYESLDHAVSEVLDGKAEPKAALSDVAKHWRELTQQAGEEQQMSAWRQAQGRRA